MEEATPIKVVATCRTPDCPVENVPISCVMFSSVTPPVFTAVCAQCHQPVTDIVIV